MPTTERIDRHTTDDPARGTGRSTRLVLRAILAALERPGHDVEFQDHEPMTFYAAHVWHKRILCKVQVLGMASFIEVRNVKNRVLLRCFPMVGYQTQGGRTDA